VNRCLKPVAVMVLLAFISPSLFAVSNCIGKNANASRCQPGCLMMEMKTGVSNQVSGTPAGDSCCKVSGRLPASNQTAISQQIGMAGTVQLAVSVPQPNVPPDRLIRLQETAPPVCISSHQALLCTFLV